MNQTTDYSSKTITKKRYGIALLFIVPGLVAMALRLGFNFSQELIPGVNGGYYPLQVRTLLNTGQLGFADMPLLFYLQALIVKMLEITGIAVSDQTILGVVKGVDSTSLPLLLIPVYNIYLIFNPGTKRIYALSAAAFAGLSFSPLVLVSDLQKNALALVFAVFFIQYLLFFTHKRRSRYLYLSGLFLLLASFTHSGTLVFCLGILSAGAGYLYGKRALIPLALLIAVSLGLVALFDLDRFLRIIAFPLLLFENPLLFSGMAGPPDIFNIAFSIFMGIWVLTAFAKHRTTLELNIKSTVFASSLLLFAFSFPLLDAEYFRRLSLFLFIPQTLLILVLPRLIPPKTLTRLASFLLVLTVISVAAAAGSRKMPVLSQEAYNDLKRIQKVINENKSETLVIARHGLEWWTAWALHTKIAQDKAVDEELLQNYPRVLVINQLKGFAPDHERTLFHEPRFPSESQLIDSSSFFRVYEWAK